MKITESQKKKLLKDRPSLVGTPDSELGLIQAALAELLPNPTPQKIKGNEDGTN